MRIDPPMSVPIPTVAIPAQTAAALPPLEPPGAMPARQGLFVAGQEPLVGPTAPARPPQSVSPTPPPPRARARAPRTVSSPPNPARPTAPPPAPGTAAP